MYMWSEEMNLATVYSSIGNNINNNNNKKKKKN